MNLTDEQRAEAEKIATRWIRMGLGPEHRSDYVVGACAWRNIDRLAIHFVSGDENGEVYIWRWIGKTSTEEYRNWWRVGRTVRPRFMEGMKVDDDE